MAKEIVPAAGVALIRADNVPGLLRQVRPQWQAKRLMERVRALLDVDPSSACQRILNAAIADLKEKVVLAGLDIATEAASQHKLPPIVKDEDVERYSTSKLIDLCYRMGLLSRPEWRRLHRCYEIRRDLEHEDDEYEAGPEDCIYIFKTCVEVVLSRDPIQVVRIADFKAVVEQPSAIVPNEVLLEDFKNAPQPRQEEIGKFLLSIALDKKQPDLVQQNAFTSIGLAFPLLSNPARVALGNHLQQAIGRDITERQVRVAHAAGLLPYIRQAARSAFFETVLRKMEKVGPRWTAWVHHGDLLRDFIEYGGLDSAPAAQREKILLWLIRTYLGESGGVTSFGNVRHVFYSDAAAGPIQKIISAATTDLAPIFDEIERKKSIKSALANSHISRRWERLKDLLDT